MSKQTEWLFIKLLSIAAGCDYVNFPSEMDGQAQYVYYDL